MYTTKAGTTILYAIEKQIHWCAIHQILLRSQLHIIFIKDFRSLWGEHYFKQYLNIIVLGIPVYLKLQTYVVEYTYLADLLPTDLHNRLGFILYSRLYYSRCPVSCRTPQFRLKG